MFLWTTISREHTCVATRDWLYSPLRPQSPMTKKLRVPSPFVGWSIFLSSACTNEDKKHRLKQNRTNKQMLPIVAIVQKKILFLSFGFCGYVARCWPFLWTQRAEAGERFFLPNSAWKLNTQKISKQIFFSDPAMQNFSYWIYIYITKLNGKKCVGYQCY